MLKNGKTTKDEEAKNFNVELKTIKEVCAILNISRPTLYQHIKEGLPVIYVGTMKRFNIDEVINWYRQSTSR